MTVKPTGCGFDPFIRSGVADNAALSSATQQAIPPEFGKTWGTECLNTRFPLSTLLCAEYSVKLIKRIQKAISAINFQHNCVLKCNFSVQIPAEITQLS